MIRFPLQFADSWSACITQSQTNSPPSSNSTCTSSSNPQMKPFRGVVDTLTSFLNPPKDAGHQKLQVSCSLLITFVFFCCVTPLSLVVLEGHGCVTTFQSCVWNNCFWDHLKDLLYHSLLRSLFLRCHATFLWGWGGREKRCVTSKKRMPRRLPLPMSRASDVSFKHK